MLISAAPIAIPVTTANLPTEAVASEAIVRPRIPQPSSPTESTANKNSTEFSEQGRSNAQNNLPAEQQTTVNERQQGSDRQEAEADAQDQNQNQNSEARPSDTQRSNQDLDTEQLALVRQLRGRDREVRAHEQAHAAVGGSLAGAPNLSYTTGPDGRRYAVSGEVSIDAGAVSGDPAATVRKLDQVRRAALAPANPSSQDRSVASSASSSANQARGQIRVDRSRENTEARDTRDARAEATQETEESSVEKADRTNTISKPSLNPNFGRIQAEQLTGRLLSSGAFARNEAGANVSVIA